MKGFIQDEDVGTFACGVSVSGKVAQCSFGADVEAGHFKERF